MATPAFWVFGLTMSVWGMIYAGVALFNVDIFRERGFDDERLYFNVLALVTVVALGANLVFGWLVNYVGLNRLLGRVPLGNGRVAVGIASGDATVAGLPVRRRPGDFLGSRGTDLLRRLGKTLRHAGTGAHSGSGSNADRFRVRSRAVRLLLEQTRRRTPTVSCSNVLAALMFVPGRRCLADPLAQEPCTRREIGARGGDVADGQGIPLTRIIHQPVG